MKIYYAMIYPEARIKLKKRTASKSSFFDYEYPGCFCAFEIVSDLFPWNEQEAFSIYAPDDERHPDPACVIRSSKGIVKVLRGPIMITKFRRNPYQTVWSPKYDIEPVPVTKKDIGLMRKNLKVEELCIDGKTHRVFVQDILEEEDD